MDHDHARFRIDDPEFLDSGTCILLLLVYQIQAAGLWRENLNDKVGCTLRSCLGQNSEPFVQNNNDIRLKDVDLIQINVKRSVEEFTDWVALQIAVQFKLQVTGNFLMKTVRRGSHIKIALDQLIPRSSLRQELVILDGERRKISVYRHTQPLRSNDASFNVST